MKRFAMIIGLVLVLIQAGCANPAGAQEFAGTYVVSLAESYEQSVVALGTK